MWEYNYTQDNNELYHYGVLGMKWGHRKKYLNSSGNLNKLGQARKRYEDAKATAKKLRNKRSAWGQEAINRAVKATSDYNRADVDRVMAKAKYAAAKQKNAKKAERAEFNTYKKEMFKSGLAGSDKDAISRGRSTLLRRKITAEKGKEYVDRVSKKIENETVAAMVGSAVVGVGFAAVATWLQIKNS